MAWFANRWFGPAQEFLSANEEASLTRLAAASRRAANQDIKSAAGAESCAAYLVAVEGAAVALQIAPTPRVYRASFPLNYRSLFPGEARSYRADVLEASLEHYNVIWVNGEKFEFSAEATRRAEELQLAWIELGSVLERWSRFSSRTRAERQSADATSARPARSELTHVLKALDTAWASFEERYISELVQIEAKARSLIVQAIEHEKRLQELELQHGENTWEMQQYREVLRLTVAAVARLNSVANVNRKGRDDLRVEVLLHANMRLRECSAMGAYSQDADIMHAAKILSTDVVESFNAMRHYLREVGNCLERVDPHLGNNSGLVTRLVDWEESWEVGTAYLQQQRVLQALCDAVAEIRKVQTIAPKLADMFDECDVELFLVLPRLIWIRFLANQQKQIPLLVRLLPHRFTNATSSSPSLGPELQAFYEKYCLVERSLADSQVDRAVDSRALLASRVVNGADGNTDDLFSSVRGSDRANVQAKVEVLMHDLEAWSIELQRHCPEDWNQYSAVLVHCLRSDGEKERRGPFGV
jgi:hypothetical protein